MIFILIFSAFIGIGIECSDLRTRGVPTTVKTFVNKTVVLPCQVFTGTVSKVTWEKEGVILADSEDPKISPEGIVMDKWNLKVLNVQPDDSGEYICKVYRSPPWGDVTQIYAIEVLYSPSVHTIPESGELEVNLGDEVDMACIAKGVPTPTITWNNKDKEIQLISRRARLQFRADNLNLAGRYTCIANNTIGDPAIAHIDLKLRYKPQVNVINQVVHSAPGIRATLECEVKAWPEPTVNWFFFDNKIEYSDRIVRDQNIDKNIYSLHIRRVRKEDFGSYTCEAKNELGHTIGSVELSGTPKPVVLLSSRALSPTTYNFIWEVDSYLPILNCMFRFRELEDGNKLSSKKGDWHNVYVPSMISGPVHAQSFNLTGLNESALYEAKISCENRYGYSETNYIHFSTAKKYAEVNDESSSKEVEENDETENHLATMSQQSSQEAKENKSSMQFNSFNLIICVALILKLID